LRARIGLARSYEDEPEDIWNVACVSPEFFQHCGWDAKSFKARACARSSLKVGLIK
jgi:hypothetical protein